MHQFWIAINQWPPACAVPSKKNVGTRFLSKRKLVAEDLRTTLPKCSVEFLLEGLRYFYAMGGRLSHFFDLGAAEVFVSGSLR